MTDEYSPVYAKGKVMVSFKNNPSRKTVKYFSECFGYEFLGEELFPNFYSFKTEIGKEDVAIKDFQKYDEFVNVAERIDEKYLKRTNFQSDLELMVQDLGDYTDTIKFKDKLLEVKSYIEKYKD